MDEEKIMPISPKRKWRSSERIALSFLEELGFSIIDTHVKIRIDGIEITEIDAIVEDENGEKYAVEIKAGRIDVSGIRQAYVNAQIAGCKPLVVAKGFADEAAQVLAEKLGVKVIQLSDYFLVEAEELEEIVNAAINNFLEELVGILVDTKPPGPEDYEFLKKIASSKTIKELAEETSLPIHDVVKKIRRLQNKGILPKTTRNYSRIRILAQMIMLREEFRRFKSLIESLGKQINT